MTPIAQFIARHKAARYAFVLISFPLVAARDELARLRYYRPEMGLDDLRRALAWARVGGTPGQVDQPRPEPTPMHPKWSHQAATEAHHPHVPYADVHPDTMAGAHRVLRRLEGTSDKAAPDTGSQGETGGAR